MIARPDRGDSDGEGGGLFADGGSKHHAQGFAGRRGDGLGGGGEGPVICEAKGAMITPMTLREVPA